MNDRQIDLNVDIGEGFPFDLALLEFASSANVCCGEHAGSWDLTLETVARCREAGVRVGAHPGYPDRASMGRRSMPSECVRDWLQSIHAQIERFARECEPSYVKPHGALYNDTAVLLPLDWGSALRSVESEQAYHAVGLYLAQYPGLQALSMSLRIHRLALMGLVSTAHWVIAERAGVPLIREGFADRRYTDLGTLVPRSEPGAMLTDPNEIRRQVLLMADQADSICLHGDGERVLEFAELVYKTLVDSGYKVAP